MSRPPHPAVGSRIELGKHIGTIRYIGPVAGYAGRWYGVEWDEPCRGKHDGSKDGVRYFTCTAPGTPASFVKETAPTLSLGTTFLDALEKKYLDVSESDQVETVVLGSSGGAIVVEAPRLSKVRRRLARLEDLKVVSLDGVSSPGENSEIESKSLKIQSLDLSKSLLATWDDVLRIVAQLPRLTSLSLDDNRLASPGFLGTVNDHRSLQELTLNNCHIPIHEIWTLSSVFPGLRHLEVAQNHLTSLDAPLGSCVFRQLESLNVASNEIADWATVARTIRILDTLQRLVVADNLINVIPSPAASEESAASTSLRHLSLQSNRIHSWTSIDALAACYPDLVGLNVQDNAFLDDPATRGCARQLLLARFAKLSSLNNSPIANSERKDSELFYLAFIAKAVPPQDRPKQPRWLALCAQYGAPDEVQAAPALNNLNSRLIELYVKPLSTVPTTRSDELGPGTSTIKVLPSMNLKTLRAKVLKSLNLRPPRTASVRLWAILHAKTGWVAGEMDLGGDGGKEIDFWGLENGSGRQGAMENDEIESVLYVCREVMVYRVPPRTSNAGYRAEGWGDLSAYIWKGRMRIIESEKCTIRLEDASSVDCFCAGDWARLPMVCPCVGTSGEVFAQCPYDVTGTSVEPVLDSSRYFVLRVEDAGRKAYIGIGFAERSDAFDFNVALQDYTKRQKALLNPETNDPSTPSPHLPAVKKDFSLKQGQTLGSISIPGGSSAPPKKKPASGGLLGSGSGIPLLPPPPPSSRKT
ncbi:hypothetical protein FRB99_001159 [Tulasnella sp. 403]|nr:hypothetical protein FRB99_001159 [Tulasnella sp. 403]